MKEILCRMKFETSLGQVCTVCNTHVKERTKHCGQCNRCVDRFDHHCKWLNNCIGRENYQYFIKMILFLLVLGIMKMVVTIVCLTKYKGNLDKIYILKPVTFLSLFRFSLGKHHL